MTNMNFSLSPTLTSQLQQPGVYAYAVAFSSSTYVATDTLVSNGVIQNASLSMALPASFTSGAVYVVIQQGGNGSLASQLQSLGNITPQNASANNYSYQLLEATLTPSVYDQGDISAVNTFAFPTSYSVVSNGQTLSLGFAPGQTGNSVYTSLGNAQTFNPNTFTSNKELSVGPAASNNANPFPYQDWTAYVTNLKNNPAALADITLIAPFAGGTSLQSSPMLSQYGVQYVASDSFGTDYFWLVPNNQNGATNTDWIRIPATQLMQNIYIQPGPLEIHAGVNGQPSPTATYQTSFTPNDADGAVAKYFVAGFDAGYWGGSGTSANAKDPTVSDLSKTWNWNVNYAYDATLTSTGIKYTNTLGTGPGTSGGQNRFYDPWAETIQKGSNAYGYSYTDLVSLGGVNPQITLWDPSQPNGSGGYGNSVANINIGLYSNSETLPSTSGFQTAPSVYIPPTGTTYSPVNKAVTGNANQIGFAFQFALGSLNFSPNGSTPAAFRFYAPGDAMADPTTGFVTLTIPVLQGQIISQNNASEQSIWNILTVTGGPGTWGLASNAGSNPYSQQEGQISLYNVPVTSDGTTGWYELVFGSGSNQTVYNIYADNVNGVFQPITGTGSNPNNFVVDHGVGITQSPSPAGYYTLNFAPGGNMLYSINTFSAPNTIQGTSAADTLVGTSSNDIFNGGPGNDKIDGLAGTDTAVTFEPSNNFTLKMTAGFTALTMQDKVGNQGTDTLTSIEQIKFADRTIDVTPMAKTAAQTPSQIMKVVDLYTAGLNRAPDALGLDYYVAKLADGVSLSDISKSIFGSTEAAPIYTSANANPVVVNFAYQNAFGHAPDAAGLAYWTNELNTGHLQRTDLVTALIAGATGIDKQYVTNKETVGAHFALTAGLNNATWAQTVESAVNATAATVTAANAQTDAFALTAATPATSELVVQITGIVP